MKNIELTQKYRELDRDLALLYYQIQGWNNEVQTPFVSDDTAMAALDETWKALQGRVQNLNAPDKVYELVRHHFTDFLSTLAFMMDHVRKQPEAALLNYYFMIAKIAWLDDREDAVRCQDLVDRYRAVTEKDEDYIRLICGRHSAKELKDLISSVEHAQKAMLLEGSRLAEHFPGFTQEQNQTLLAAINDYCDFLGHLKTALQAASHTPEAPGNIPIPRDADELRDHFHVEDVAMTGHRFTSGQPGEMEKAEFCEDEYAREDLSITVKLDPEEYRAILRDQQGVDLDELLAWHQSEIQKTREDCFRIARDLSLPDTDPTTMKGVNDILFRFEPPCETGQEMHRRCNEYLQRTRALAHEYVKLPEDEQAVCVPIPQIYTASYAWGGYEGGDFRHAPYIGKMFLNQYNTRNITDGWIKLNALHESYPGHHCQFVRAAIDPTPETVKIGSRLIPILEGTCLRTETRFCNVFAEDPVFPLFIAYRRHHASVRIYVDLMMFYHGASLQDVIDIYQRELDFDYVTARAQVQAHQASPGYFTCYYYGMKKICQWEEDYGYSNKDYTELLFSAGYISMESLHMLVQMSPEEQQRYFTEFPSMLR